MPHCIIEYSNDLDIDPKTLVNVIHAGAIQSALFDSAAIKTRAMAYEHFIVGEGNRSFIHVSAKMLAGRTNEQKNHLSSILFSQLQSLKLNNCTLTVEIIDLDKLSYAKT